MKSYAIKFPNTTLLLIMLITIAAFISLAWAYRNPQPGGVLSAVLGALLLLEYGSLSFLSSRLRLRYRGNDLDIALRELLASRT